MRRMQQISKVWRRRAQCSRSLFLYELSLNVFQDPPRDYDWIKPSNLMSESEVPLVGATRLRGILCNPVCSVPCILCTLSSASRLPVSASESLVGFRDPAIDVTRVREPTHDVARLWGVLRAAMKSHQIASYSPGQQRS